jgi:diaminopimelate decarboxylase
VIVSSPADLVNIVKDILPSDITAILEPGRSLVGNSAILLSRVLGTKITKEKKYCYSI